MHGNTKIHAAYKCTQEEADLDSNSSQDGAASFNVGDAVSNSESSSDLIQIDDNLAGVSRMQCYVNLRYHDLI